MTSGVFKYDPIPALLAFNDPALTYFTRRDLLHESVPPVQTLWTLPEPVKILKHQRPDGSWKYPGGSSKFHERTGVRVFYDQIQTWLMLSILIDKYGFTKEHEQIRKAVQFMFATRQPEGDFRGWLGHQYMPYYTGAFTATIIKAGYADDFRLTKTINWLLSMRQDDGGWAIPFRTKGYGLKIMYDDIPPVEPDRSRPSSHLSTEMVLRAFAVHPKYRKLPEAQAAGELLISRLFKRDPYPDRNIEAYWYSSSYPFWFTNIASALVTLSQLGFTMEQPGIRVAVEKLAKIQDKNGLFRFKMLRSKEKATRGWVTLQIFGV